MQHFPQGSSPTLPNVFISLNKLKFFAISTNLKLKEVPVGFWIVLTFKMESFSARLYNTLKWKKTLSKIVFQPFENLFNRSKVIE